MGIAIIIVYLLATFVSFAIPVNYKMDENIVLDNEKMVKNGIINLYRGSLRLEIEGWAYKEGQAVNTFNNSFVLKNREDNKMFILKTGKQMVQELQFVDGYECLNCGMVSNSIVLGFKKGAYDLYILYKNNFENLLVDTGVEVDI